MSEPLFASKQFIQGFLDGLALSVLFYVPWWGIG